MKRYENQTAIVTGGGGGIGGATCRRLAAEGVRPLILGAAAWIFISGFALLLVRLVG